MLRYAHLRAVERKLDVNFAQRLAEDSRFPDNHFDLVTSYIMFHEVSPEATRAIVKEAYRITRPGGVFYPIDFRLTNAPRRTAYGLYRLWWDHRWNNEVWALQYRQSGLPNLIRAAGFALNESEPEALPNFGVLNATKPA
jgi:ubiquinone/menaquinone biosynthesis C-methylase UbiE